MVNAYKLNNIIAYSQFQQIDSVSTLKDSVLLNQNGQETDWYTTYTIDKRKYLRGGHNKYDSHKRLISFETFGPFPDRGKLTYKIDKKNHLILQKVGSGIKYYSYDNSFNRLLRTFVTDSSSNDTLDNRYYIYKNKNIFSIIETSGNKRIEKIKYLYDESQRLKMIRDDKYISYISKSTGLIDSAKTLNGKRVLYKYYRHK